MRIRINLLLIVLILFVFTLIIIASLTGCGSTVKTTQIKEEIISVKVPEIKDTIKTEWIGLPDTLKPVWENFKEQIADSVRIEGTKTTTQKDGRTTKVKATYYPKKDTLILEAKQSELQVLDIDTTQVYQENKVSLVEKLGWGVIVLIILGSVIFVFTKFFRKK